MANLTTSNEVWKDIFGYEGLYKISNLGRVFSIVSKKTLKQAINTRDRPYVILSKKGIKRLNILIHRLVAIHFVPNHNPVEKPQVNHIDGDKLNNKADNLEWVNNSENQKHAYRIGLKNANNVTGEKNHFSKLKESDIRLIRLSKESSRSLAKKLGIGKTTINMVRSGKTWKHVR